MEREEGDERAKADDEQGGDDILRARGDLRLVREHRGDVIGAGEIRQADEAGEQDDGAKSEVDRDLPRSRPAVSAAEDADHEEGRDEGELVEGIEEEQVGRGESPERAGRDEQRGTEVKFLAADGRFPGEHGGERDDHGQQHHDDAHAISEGKGEVESRLFKHRRGEGPDGGFPREDGGEAEHEIERGGGDGCEAGGRAEEDRKEREDREKDEQEEHGAEGK